MTCDPTLPRYGTDPAQVCSMTFEAKKREKVTIRVTEAKPN